MQTNYKPVLIINPDADIKHVFDDFHQKIVGFEAILNIISDTDDLSSYQEGILQNAFGAIARFTDELLTYSNFLYAEIIDKRN